MVLPVSVMCGHQRAFWCDELGHYANQLWNDHAGGARLLPCHGIFRTFWEWTGSWRNTR